MLAEGHVHSWVDLVPGAKSSCSRSWACPPIGCRTLASASKRTRSRGPIMDRDAVHRYFPLSFSTPALRYLEQIAPSLCRSRARCTVFTGGLSSVLDNAPTYMTFFEMAKRIQGEGTPDAARARVLPDLIFCCVLWRDHVHR